jgi:DNA-directed RNA polymerase subunit M/transcription elongation factor TFIIS
MEHNMFCPNCSRLMQSYISYSYGESQVFYKCSCGYNSQGSTVTYDNSVKYYKDLLRTDKSTSNE